MMHALPGTTGRRRIYLMRHGHVDYFSEEVARTGSLRDVPLTQLGRDEATASGKALSHVAFDIVLSSGLPRTRETLAHVIAENEGRATLAAEADPRLEEIHGGRIFGARSRREIATAMTFQFERAHEEGATMFEGGEAFADALARARCAIEDLLHRPQWHTALVVAHEGTNRLLLGWMTGANLAAIRAFEQDTACINILDFDLVPRTDGTGVEIERKMIKALNLTPYNYAKAGMNLTSLERIFERL
ncbi:MAG TPA: histidine phosphatase family protein [Micropepsaceae bacterium]|nr:histidine phosphatase family protein [Micropepsaceae bacterium]